MSDVRFTAQSQAVIDLLRKEMEAGRIPPEHAAFLEKAVKVTDSLGIIGNFVIRFAAFLTGVAALWTLWPRQ